MSEEQMKYVANLISQDLEKDKEIERLNNIIKEVREYLEIFTSFDECTINGRMVQKAIDILDKENKDENNNNR